MCKGSDVESREARVREGMSEREVMKSRLALDVSALVDGGRSGTRSSLLGVQASRRGISRVFECVCSGLSIGCCCIDHGSWVPDCVDCEEAEAIR